MLFTYAFVAIIGLAFILFLIEDCKLFSAGKALEKLCNKEDILSACQKTKLESLASTYTRTLIIKIEGHKKSNVPASEIINENSLTKAFKTNLRMLDSASGTLVGLGLLGTFGGLTIGIYDFQSETSEQIQGSIKGLLDGMGLAFATSLAGMFLSLAFTLADKYFRNRMFRHLHSFTEKLDSLYYIDDVAILTMNQEAMMSQLRSELKREFESKLSFTTNDGETSTIANAVREILKENEEQSKALKSFSTDLAIELNNGFDESLSRQMQEKIVPMMENIDQTTHVLIDHIDEMSKNVASPATDMIQNVVTELKASMSSIMAEFSKGLSGSATIQLEGLAIQLGTAAQSMADFPKHMEGISTTLEVTIEEVKNAISEIANTSATSNSTAMQQMQEQITFATTSISNAIMEVKEVMATITSASEQSSSEMTSQLAAAAQKMSEFLNGAVSGLSSSLQSTVQSMSDDLAAKQTDLIALQEDSATQTKKLLDSFNVGLERLEKMNEYIAGTMNQFQQAQGQITGTTSHLQTISGDMKMATEVFRKSQSEYTTSMIQIQQASQNNIDTIAELIENSSELSDDYVNKFELIKNALGGIFTQLQSGLSEYSRAVQKSTQEYLDIYSTSLTSTTDSLKTTIERQNEVVETLVESLNARKK